jgi:hypothetical protein
VRKLIDFFTNFSFLDSLFNRSRILLEKNDSALVFRNNSMEIYLPILSKHDFCNVPTQWAAALAMAYEDPTLSKAIMDNFIKSFEVPSELH